MTRSRVRAGAAAAALLLALTGCAKIDSNQQPPSGGGNGVDDKAVKSGGTLRIALDGEPDKLDPTLARTLVGRNVFAAICEKLFDVNEKLEVVPQLAAAMPDVSSDG